MATFKVICKADGNNWESWQRTSKVVTTKKFFGFVKSYEVVSEPNRVPGPQRDEVCIVTDDYLSNDEKYYKLAGYPYGGYNAKYFVRLDEFTETQKEIAEKSEPVLN